MPKASKFARAKRITVRSKQTKSKTNSAKAISKQVEEQYLRTVSFMENCPHHVTFTGKNRAAVAAAELEYRKNGLYVERLNSHTLLLDVSKERHQRAIDFHKKFVAELLAKKAIANTSKK